MSDLALSIKNLKKEYKGGFKALKGVNLEVKKGDFFALLGPNGAGKSTIIGILTSLVNKSSGSVKIFDVDIDKNFSLAKTFVGVVPQEFNFDMFQTVEQVVLTQAGFYGIEKNEAKKRAQFYLEKLELLDKKNSQARMLSGGMKRRLMIARALIHEPKLLILDEPTAGVDLELRRSMWDFISDLNKQKKITIILTTHYLEEAEHMAKNVAIINHGEIIENTSIKKLLKKSQKETFILDLKNEFNLVDKLDLEGFDFNLVDLTTLEVSVLKNTSITDLLEKLKLKGIEVLSMRNKSNRLEELFLELTKK